MGMAVGSVNRFNLRMHRFQMLKSKVVSMALVPVAGLTFLALTGCSTCSCTKHGAVAGSPSPAAHKYLSDWPANADPQLVGEKVAADLLPRKIYLNAGGKIVYPEVCAAFG